MEVLTKGLTFVSVLCDTVTVLVMGVETLWVFTTEEAVLAVGVLDGEVGEVVDVTPGVTVGDPLVVAVVVCGDFAEVL